MMDVFVTEERIDSLCIQEVILMRMPKGKTESIESMPVYFVGADDWGIYFPGITVTGNNRIINYGTGKEVTELELE